MSFKDTLDHHYRWPCTYVFKFIVPRESVAQVQELFPTHSLTLKESAQGRFVSVTVDFAAESADVVLAIYEKAQSIEGVIAL